MRNDPSKEFQQPVIKAFEAASLAAQRNPVETPIERLRQGVVPIHVDIDYIDVVAATPTGTSNVIRTRGNTLFIVDSLFNANSAANQIDNGGVDLWIQPDNAPADEYGRMLNVGPYFWIPHAGIYRLRGYLLATPLWGTIVSSAAKFRCTRHDGIDPLLVASLIQSKRTTWMQNRNTAVGVATTQAVSLPAAAGYHQPPATLLENYGMQGHCVRVTVSNSGANPATLSFNNNTLGANTGMALAVGQTLQFEVGGIFTLYAFSTLGTNLGICFEYM